MKACATGVVTSYQILPIHQIWEKIVLKVLPFNYFQKCVRWLRGNNAKLSLVGAILRLNNTDFREKANDWNLGHLLLLFNSLEQQRLHFGGESFTFNIP